MAERFARDAALVELRSELVRYLSPGGLVETESDLAAGATGLESRDLARLLAVQLLTHPITRRAIDVLPGLVRRLPSSSASTLTELHGSVRGRTWWAETAQRRLHSGDPTLFVCAVPERQYDTAQGRLIAATIRTVQEAVRATGWRLADGSRPSEGTAGSMVFSVDEVVRSVAAHPKLRGVPATMPSPEVLHALAGRGELVHLCAFADLYQRLLVDRSAEAVAETLAERFFAPAPDRLFELLIGFRLARAFADHGWEQIPVVRLLGPRAPIARLRKNGASLDIWWQRSAFATKAAKAAGLEAGELDVVRVSSGARVGPYRPDLILEHESVAGRRAISIGEVKLTHDPGVTAEARGIQESFAYLYDAQKLGAVVPIRAFVVAWNANGRPAPGRVAVSDQNHLRELAALLENTCHGI